IDIPNRALSVVGCAGEKTDPQAVQGILEERQKKWQPPTLQQPRGLLQRYCRQAGSAMKGAYLME
ncbi:MAG: dihydroxy-acid dehydratase, partial [Pseudomonadota bacterium]